MKIVLAKPKKLAETFFPNSDVRRRFPVTKPMIFHQIPPLCVIYTELDGRKPTFFFFNTVQNFTIATWLKAPKV
jgi:hypothetical protein